MDAIMNPWVMYEWEGTVLAYAADVLFLAILVTLVIIIYRLCRTFIRFFRKVPKKSLALDDIDAKIDKLAEVNSGPQVVHDNRIPNNGRASTATIGSALVGLAVLAVALLLLLPKRKR